MPNIKELVKAAKDGLVNLQLDNIPWNETGIGNAYMHVEEAIGVHDYIINNYTVVSYNPENKTFVLNFTLDILDVELDEEE